MVAGDGGGLSERVTASLLERGRHRTGKPRFLFNTSTNLPGSRHGKEGAFEKQIAGNWHIVTLQEAIDANRFHVTHYGRCAVLFNKDTFFSNIKVKSIYLHDTRRELPDKVMEGDSGWVLQGVLSRASFRRQPLSGQKNIHRYTSCEAGCAYNGITDVVTNLLMKVQHVTVSENSVHKSCVSLTVVWTWNFVLSRQP